MSFAREERPSGESGAHDDIRCHFHPTPEQIADLIARAKAHELGIDFLRRGSQASVAATFGVHAFTVDAARRQLDDAREE